MLTDSELATLMQDKEVLHAVLSLKKDFIEQEGDFLEITDEDFMSLVLLAPSVGIALANGSISLFEELTLNKKARRLSRGSYFVKKDPVVHSLQFLVKNFDTWEERFYSIIKQMIFSTFRQSPPVLAVLQNPKAATNNLGVDILNAPYIFIKFITFLFLDEEDDLLNERSVSNLEFRKIEEIGKKIGIADLPIFQMFCRTFAVR